MSGSESYFKILVSDDDEQIVALYRRILEIKGDQRSVFPADITYEVTYCRQGEEALRQVEEALAASEPYALTFMDVRMPPGKGGIWAAERIRRIDHEVNIVFVSAYNELSPEEIAWRIPPLDKVLYLQKPFTPQEIKQFVYTLTTKWKTERKLAAVHLEEKNRLAMAIEQVAEIVVMVDLERRIQYVNPAFIASTGYNKHEVVGKGIDLLNSERYGDIFSDEVLKTVSSGNIWKGRGIHRRKDGSLYEAETAISPVRDAEEIIFSYVLVSRDITKEVKLEAQLRQAQKMEAIGELASGIAHEINTPTQYVNDNLCFLQKSFDSLQILLRAAIEFFGRNDPSEPDPDKHRRVHKLIEDLKLDFLLTEIPLATRQAIEGNQRIADIVKAIKEFTHPGSREKTFININRAIESTLLVARNEWKYVAKIDTDFDEELPNVLCFPGEFNQAILNLVVNAAQAIAMSERKDDVLYGQIGIKTWQEGESVFVMIRDDGIGIEQDLRDRIFEPFFTTKEVGKGTGQGLALVHTIIVEKHGGTIDVESVPGKETTFIISVPVAEHKEDAG